MIDKHWGYEQQRLAQRRALDDGPTSPTDTWPMYKALRDRIEAMAQFDRDEKLRRFWEDRREERELDRMLRERRKAYR